jgi:organic radical activating enzyme
MCPEALSAQHVGHALSPHFSSRTCVSIARVRVSELFLSVQGEGRLTGRPMYFIRAQGCAVRCPIRADCDQPEALTFRGGDILDPAALAARARDAVGTGGWVCLTGGEPAEQPDFADVVQACRRAGLRVNLQTSGLRDVPVPVDWCTVSPKAPAADLVVRTAHEVKVVYTGQSLAELGDYLRHIAAHDYFLQPCWRGTQANTRETLDMVMAAARAGLRYEFSAQWHKVLAVK